MLRRFLAARAMRAAVTRADNYNKVPHPAWDVRTQMILNQRAVEASVLWAAL